MLWAQLSVRCSASGIALSSTLPVTQTAFLLILWKLQLSFPKFHRQSDRLVPGCWEEQTQCCWSLWSLCVCLALHLGVCSDCWFCLHSLEHRGPPSGTNSAKQSPAPQHRPLGPAQSSASSTDRYRALGLRRWTENNQTSLELLNARVTFCFLLPLCRGATEGEAGKEVSNSYRLSWPEHKHLAQPDAGSASGVGSRHSQAQVSMQSHAKYMLGHQDTTVKLSEYSKSE